MIRIPSTRGYAVPRRSSIAVMITEFGSFDCGTDYPEALLDYVEARAISWVAWAWFPGGCEFPGLIEDWTATPSAVGELVRVRMGG